MNRALGHTGHIASTKSESTECCTVVHPQVLQCGQVYAKVGLLYCIRTHLALT